ncbi:MAG TPA: glutamate synthase-related protein [Methanoregulaceae archaeon]|nr:glutamate synthase-related protein [Methanoregulaceae archaeon]
MTLYRCNVCNTFEYDPERGSSLTGIRPGTEPPDFPDSWSCPICGSDKTHLKPVYEVHEKTIDRAFICSVCGTKNIIPGEEAPQQPAYLEEWARKSDSLEVYMEDIHTIAVTGESIWEPMRTKNPVISWDKILIKGAQLARIPIGTGVPVNTKTVIGPDAGVPLVLETPVYVTHMSFGALSREVKISLAKGSAAVKTAIGSGEGGILADEKKEAYRYIFEYVPNRYSVTEENLRSVDAIEIKIGQSAEPGLGARLPAEKVTDEIAAIRGYPAGTDIVSPAIYEDIRNREELKDKIEWLREMSGGKPIGVKIAAGDIEEDLDIIISAGADFVTVDGRPGATGAAIKYIKDATSVPTPFALYRARKHLDSRGADKVSLIITGGLRISSDFAKALAMGADAIAIGTAALMACGCQQYRLCTTGTCPVGVTTQDPALRKRLDIDISAKKLENYLRVSTNELRDFARLTGYSDVHDMSIDTLCTASSEISDYTSIHHV